MSPVATDHISRMQRAVRSLDGLSVGDAFGERLFGPPLEALHRIETRAIAASPWKRDVSQSVFGGGGSMGNGGAMRIAPVGAYFLNDIDAAVEAARLSAEVTHAHPEWVW
jgi:hypothetical protein